MVFNGRLCVLNGGFVLICLTNFGVMGLVDSMSAASGSVSFSVEGVD